jgi:hypothetical protein
MKRATFFNSPALLQVLVWAAALAVIACGDVNISPTGPTFGDAPFAPVGGGRNLEIVGSLTAEQGSCFEATVLYDGEELAGARTVCGKASGCARLKLTALARSSTGHHTISFQVLRQSPAAVRYVAHGSVVVSRDGLSLGGVTLPLGPTGARLRPGESVSFDVSFQN